MTKELPLFRVCFPEQDPDEWHEQDAADAADAATGVAEYLCDIDCDWRHIFSHGTPALARLAIGGSVVHVFDVQLELVPVFSATPAVR